MKYGKFLKPFILLNIGGFLYYFIEILWRGYSHWTMFILGGICFLVIGAINEIFPWEMKFYKQVLIGLSIITLLEFITGCIVNLWLGWNVWDYSNLPLNILGQICVPYIILWIPVTIAAIIVDDWLRFWLFKEEKPHYYL